MVGAVVGTVLGLPLPADALRATSAKVKKAAIEVKGKEAIPFAMITWEGNPVTQADKRGKFKFTTGLRPDDCSGDVSDGSETVSAVIQKCGGPAGPPGPPGPPGPAGAGSSLEIRDVLDQLVGVIVDLGNCEFNQSLGVDRCVPPKAVREIDGRPVSFFFDETGLIDARDIQPLGTRDLFYFESNDCSGPAILPSDARQLVVPHLREIGGQGFYPLGPNGEVTAHSNRGDAGTCTDLAPFSTTIVGSPPSAPIDLGPFNSPPFQAAGP